MGRSRQINGRALWGTESGLHRVFKGSGGDAAPLFLFIDFGESQSTQERVAVVSW